MRCIILLSKKPGQIYLTSNYLQSAEYIWLDDLPIAQLQTSYGANNTVSSRVLTYIHADHLNTPRAMTDSSKKIVWRWDSDAYGLSTPNTDPDGDGIQNYLNLRFPGQTYDAETGLAYNLNRYYDPLRGIYTQSDPIGLAGGLNTYAYVKGNPIRYIDPLGLENGDIIQPGQLDHWNYNGDNSFYPADSNLNPPTKITPCELKCSLVVGTICKPIAVKTPGPWWAKVGSYAVCEVGVEYVCRTECEKKDCPTGGK